MFKRVLYIIFILIILIIILYNTKYNKYNKEQFTLYTDNDNLLEYIIYIISHIDYDEGLKKKQPKKYHHGTNAINITFLNNMNIKNLLKKSDKYINTFINNKLLNSLINSCLKFDNINLFINSLFNDDIKYKDNIIYMNMFKGINIITNPNKQFIRHSIETESMDYSNIKYNELYPPKGTYFEGDNNGAWPIELGKATYDRNEIGSRVTSSANSYCIIPILDIDIFDNYNGKTIMGEGERGRDHLYAHADIPLNEWIILFINNEKKTDTDIKNINHLLKICPVIDIKIIKLYIGLKDLIISFLINIKRLK